MHRVRYEFERRSIVITVSPSLAARLQIMLAICREGLRRGLEGAFDAAENRLTKFPIYEAKVTEGPPDGESEGFPGVSSVVIAQTPAQTPALDPAQDTAQTPPQTPPQTSRTPSTPRTPRTSHQRNCNHCSKSGTSA